MRDRVTSRVFGHWWRHRRADRAEAVSHLGGALAAAELAGGRLVREMLPGTEIGERGLDLPRGDPRGAPRLSLWVADLLRDQDINVRRTAVDALGKLGGVAATRELLALLAQLLRDQDSDVRM